MNCDNEPFDNNQENDDCVRIVPADLVDSGDCEEFDYEDCGDCEEYPLDDEYSNDEDFEEE